MCVTQKPQNLKLWLMFLILVVAWGSAFSVIKISLDDISPTWLVALRLVAATLFLSLIGLYQKINFIVPFYPILWFNFLGFIGIFAPFLLISWGSLYISSTLTGLIIAIVPIMTLILAGFFLKDEKITKEKAFLFCIGLLGVIILIDPTQILKDLKINSLKAFLAQSAVLLASFGYALNIVLTRKAPHYSTTAFSFHVIFCSTIQSCLYAFIFDFHQFPDLTLKSSMGILWLGVVSTALAALLLYHIIHKSGASFIGLTNYLVPICAAFLGYIVLGETLTFINIIGMIIIFGTLFYTKKIKFISK